MVSLGKIIGQSLTPTQFLLILQKHFLIIPIFPQETPQPLEEISSHPLWCQSLGPQCCMLKHSKAQWQTHRTLQDISNFWEKHKNIYLNLGGLPAQWNLIESLPTPPPKTSQSEMLVHLLGPGRDGPLFRASGTGWHHLDERSWSVSHARPG